MNPVQQLLLLDSRLNDGDGQIAVEHPQLVQKLLFLPVILHDDAVVQPHERAVILGADAVQMIAAAVLFQHVVKYAGIVQGFRNKDAKLLALAAEPIQTDQRQDDKQEQDSSDRQCAEADEPDAASHTGCQRGKK